MNFYLVGGAVRDKVLGIEIKERDWVVIGATEEQMIAKGYEKVGKSFPVFLHPETKEEYALARIEKKTGKGYHGFVCEASPDITLEQDLLRRDLTINAIAEDENGNFIDPYNGLADLKNKVLRHVSDAFIEDPLRVLRVARFAARFAHLGFKVHDSTLNLMTNISLSDELEQLVPERIWTEITKGLMTDKPRVFFEVLRECQALKKILPELDKLWGIPQKAEYHPEIDTGEHIMLVLDKVTTYSDNLEIRCAALFHDLGKGLTPKDVLPSHLMHEQRGVDVIEQLSNRLKLPSYCTKLATKCSKYHLLMHCIFELKPKRLLQLLYDLEAFNNNKYLEAFITVCKSDAQGRLGAENKPYPQEDYLRQAFDKANLINAKGIVEAGFEGKKVKEQLDRQRANAIAEFKKQYMYDHPQKDK